MVLVECFLYSKSIAVQRGLHTLLLNYISHLSGSGTAQVLLIALINHIRLYFFSGADCYPDEGPRTESLDHSYALPLSPDDLRARLSEALARVESLEREKQNAKDRERRAKNTVHGVLEALRVKQLINEELKERLDSYSARWMSSVDAKPGLNMMMLDMLKRRQEEDPAKYGSVCLMLDAMAIRKHVQYNPHTQEMSGFVDMGDDEQVVKPVVSVYPAASRAHLEGKSSLLCLASAMFPPLVRFSWKRQEENGPLLPAEGEQLELRESGRTAAILLIRQKEIGTYKYRCSVQHQGGTVEAQTQQEVSYFPVATFQSRVKLLCVLYTVLIVKSLVYCCGLSLLMILRNKGPSTNCTHAD
ncbi:hypothetical protein ABVT39_024977 [Epinephelus coioides]